MTFCSRSCKDCLSDFFQNPLAIIHQYHTPHHLILPFHRPPSIAASVCWMVLLYSMLPPQLIRSVLHSIQRPDATPSLHSHYRNFITTTSCSAPVPCISNLTLVALTTWTSPLASRYLVPAVPCKSPDQTHAIYTPDTTHPVARLPVSSSQVMETPLVLMSTFG